MILTYILSDLDQAANLEARGYYSGVGIISLELVLSNTSLPF